MRNNERYLAFSPAVTQAFLEVSDLRAQFLVFTFSTTYSSRSGGTLTEHHGVLTDHGSDLLSHIALRLLNSFEP